MLKSTMSKSTAMALAIDAYNANAFKNTWAENRTFINMWGLLEVSTYRPTCPYYEFANNGCVLYVGNNGIATLLQPNDKEL